MCCLIGLCFFSTQATKHPNQVGPNPSLCKIYLGDSEDYSGRTVMLSDFSLSQIWTHLDFKHFPSAW